MNLVSTQSCQMKENKCLKGHFLTQYLLHITK